jgi:hypothetical protein
MLHGALGASLSVDGLIFYIYYVSIICMPHSTRMAFVQRELLVLVFVSYYSIN